MKWSVVEKSSFNEIIMKFPLIKDFSTTLRSARNDDITLKNYQNFPRLAQKFDFLFCQFK